MSEITFVQKIYLIRILENRCSVLSDEIDDFQYRENCNMKIDDLDEINHKENIKEMAELSKLIIDFLTIIKQNHDDIYELVDTSKEHLLYMGLCQDEQAIYEKATQAIRFYES
ncbi:MAG: hypothetical protein AAFN00_05105 [Cyanobacteria bacterium J06558_2]